MQDRSLGLIETCGYTAAVEAVDVACKTASVTFVGYDRIWKGFITVKFSGDVAAVQAAVTAGAAAAQRVGRVISVHVIPRPHVHLGALGPGFPDMPTGKGEERARPFRAKKAADRETPGTKDSKTKRTRKKPPK
jgi:ethanolamine utilization protein EutM